MWVEAFSLTLTKIMYLVKFQSCMLYINFWIEHLSVQFDGTCFSVVVGHCLCEHHNTINNFLCAIFSFFLADLRLLKKFLPAFWTTKAGWEMTSWLIRWPLHEPTVVRWRNNWSVQCSSHDCERCTSLCNVTAVQSISMIFLHSDCNSLRW